LWVTPQGRFADARERLPRFEPGLGHLAPRVERASFVPLASEYVFWEEKQAEILLALGDPIVIRSGALDSTAPRSAGAEAKGPLTPDDWTRLLETRLATLQDELAKAAIRREPAAFDILLRGRAGIGGLYDVWRRFRSSWRGERFRAAHGNK
jgi:hypothetical protein